MKTKLILLSVFLLAATLIYTFTASAAIPHLINFQGKATDKAGMPLNGTYNLTFRIYNVETAGTAKWSETQPAITISNGIFQVQLGSVTPLNLAFDEPYWISIEINTDSEMSPRTRLASVPYAYKAESLSDTPVIPFYKKGFDIEYIDFNSVKITPGVIDVAGKMFTTTTYSSPLQLAYLSNPANGDWIHGQKTNNSIAYVYAYNNNGQIGFKFSDELPDLSDQLGNAVKKPYLYQRYPDTVGGIYYRYIGSLMVDPNGAISAIRSEGKGEKVSMFSVFGGDGSCGALTISSDANFSDHDSINAGRAEYTSLTIDAGKTLTIDTKFAFIGVSGDCVIHGTISAKGQGPAGGVLPIDADGHNGNPGQNAFFLPAGMTDGNDYLLLGYPSMQTGQNVSVIHGYGTVDSDVGGGPGYNYGKYAYRALHTFGGAGGSGGLSHDPCQGGAGGGAGGEGGWYWNYVIGSPASAYCYNFLEGEPTPGGKISSICSGAQLMEAVIQGGKLVGFGGGGGSGATHGRGSRSRGGAGGGIIYIEVAGTLTFDGTLDASGGDGIGGGYAGGGGGGGGGGVIVVRANSITTNTGPASTAGGVGSGTGGGGGYPGWSGAAGQSAITTN